MTHSFRWLSLPAVALSPVLGVGLVLALALGIAPTASSAPPTGRPDLTADRESDYISSRWLYGELERHRITNIEFGFDDWGLTIDTYLAHVATNLRPVVNQRVIDTISDHADVYVQFDGDYFAGAVAKLLLARRVAGLGAYVRSADLNLRGQLVSMIAPSGRVKDTGTDDFSSTISQSLAVLALARSGRVPQPVVDYLGSQQCTKGWFRQSLAPRNCREAGSDPHVDSTALAAQALIAARRDGAQLTNKSVVRVRRWLRDSQRDNGSYPEVSGAQSNSNSTGLAGQALAALGADNRAERAGAWVRGLQLTRAKADMGPARDEVGAIAPTRALLRRALDEGITAETRDVWRRSTPQAQFAVRPISLVDLAAAAT